MIFVEGLSFEAPKASEAKGVIAALAKGSKHEDLATKRKNAALIVLSERNKEAELSFRNFGNMEVCIPPGTKVKTIACERRVITDARFFKNPTSRQVEDKNQKECFSYSSSTERKGEIEILWQTVP